MLIELQYILYARKSSRAEDKQVRSIKGQKSALLALADVSRLTIVTRLAETQSAAQPGRPVFNEMLDRIERGEANAILTWSIDRLARNFVDGSRIITMLQAGIIAEIRTPSKLYLPTDNVLMLAIDLGMANQYSRDLSANTLRGLSAKAADGIYPNRAKIGYLNSDKTIVVDRRRAPVIRGAFELYASGEATIQDVSDFLFDRGILTIPWRGHKGGKRLSISRVTTLLTDPFYYGHFRYSGQLYEGKYTPIISKTLFDKVQTELARKWSAPSTPKPEPKVFLGLLRCKDCGGAITAEKQKGHIYYRCTKKNKNLPCSQPYTREEALVSELRVSLKPYSLTPEWTDDFLSRIDKERKEAGQEISERTAPLETEMKDIETNLEDLLDMRLDREIDADTYARRKGKLLSGKKTIEETLAEIAMGRKGWLEPMKDWVLTASNMAKNVETGSLHEIRGLARKVFSSNLVLDCRKPRGEAVKPWALIPQNQSGDTLVHVWRAARTYFEQIGGYCGGGQVQDDEGRTRHDGQFRRGV